ncbi:MAG: ABC transporter permease, partial [Acidimicrobiia bacterium]
MSAAAQIAVKDLKLRVRDRSAFIFGIVAPLVLAFVFNLVFGSVFDATGLGLEYGMVDLDQSEISLVFGGVLEEVEADGILTIENYANEASAERAIEDDEIDAYYLIEDGFGEGVVTVGSPTIHVVGDIDAPTSTQIAASIAKQFSIGVEATQLAIATTAIVTSSQITPQFVDSLSGDPSSAAFSYQLEDVSTATKQLDGTTYFSAAMAIFFLFFTVQFGVLGLLEEERDGTLARLKAAPIGRLSVVGGKAILAFLLGVISMTTLVVATSVPFLLNADWGAPFGVALLVIAGVLSAVGIMGLVASAAKTPEGAGNMGAIIAVVLGMLGGVFFPLGQGDDLLSKLTFLTPHAWFMRGLADLADAAPWTAALPATGALLIFAGVTGSIGWVLLRRRL